jgi:hypothetical protein
MHTTHAEIHSSPEDDSSMGNQNLTQAAPQSICIGGESPKPTPNNQINFTGSGDSPSFLNATNENSSAKIETGSTPLNMKTSEKLAISVESNLQLPKG